MNGKGEENVKTAEWNDQKTSSTQAVFNRQHGSLGSANR